MMNEVTGSIRELAPGETVKKDEIEIKRPDPHCKVCNGKGSVPVNENNQYYSVEQFPNRAARRKAKGRHIRWMPCPQCSLIRKPALKG